MTTFYINRNSLKMLLVAAGLLYVGDQADGVTINADLDLDTALSTWVDLVGADDSFTSHAGGVYNWANKDGANTVAVAGLSLGTRVVKTDNGSALTLDLNGGAITATSGDLSTAAAGATTAGALTVTNAASITLDDLLSTSGSGWGGNMTITHRGALTADQITANPAGDMYFDGDCGSAAGSAGGFSATKIDPGDSTTHLGSTTKGDLVIKGYTNVVIGDQITSARTSGGAGDGSAGSVTIGNPAPANAAGHIAGLIKVGAIYCTAKPAIGVSCVSGDVQIYGKDDVLIKNSSDVVGDILAYPDFTARDCDGGTVTVKHDGAFAVRDVISRVGNANDTYAGRPLYFDGDILSNGITAGKNFSARTLEARVGGSSNYKRGGDVAIKGYDNVAVVSFITYQASTHFNVGGKAGDILITNVLGSVNVSNLVSSYAAKTAGGGNFSVCARGDVVISATNIDLRSLTAPASNGTLSVMATGTGARIYINNLDITNVVRAYFYAEGCSTFITNGLANFHTNSPLDGFLDAGPLQRVRYDSSISGNAYLTNGSSGIYNLKSGGLLTCNTTLPEVNDLGVSNILPTSAVLVGSVYTGAAPATILAYVGTNSQAWSQTNSMAVVSAGSFTFPVTSLLPDKLYYYKLYVTNQYGGALQCSTNSFVTAISQNQQAYKMRINFSGYDKAETLTNFPALIVFSNNPALRFSYSDVRSPNGWDLRFQNSNETRVLNYEIETWATNTNSFVWVQVPEFSSNCSIWAYWGNSGATSAPAVYTTNGSTWTGSYSAVYHMATNSGALSAADATRVNDGSVVGNPAAAAGRIGGAAAFTSTGNNDIAVPDNASLRITSKLTLSGWIYPTGYNANGSLIVQKRNPTSDNPMNYGFWLLSSGRLFFQFYNGGYKQVTNAVSTAPLSTWTYATVVVDESAGKARFYFNGVEDGAPGFTGGLTTAGNHALQIGNYGAYLTGNNQMNGRIDEVRISATAKSSNWVWACWLNQGSNSVFNTFSAVQAIQRGTFFSFR